ncbi:MAG: DUF4270 domain-containing protein [Bacteroidales bacterium]|nr:DUF4270 domain-containing protein [Bacteroidales bacterium]
MRNHGMIAGLIVLPILFSLVSCIEKNPTLGSALVPSNQDIAIHTVTLDLPVTLRMADSLQTSISGNATVGAIRSRDYGLFHCDAAMSVTSANDSVIWGKNPSVRRIYADFVLDSVMLMDKSQLHVPQNLYIHQLKVDLDSTTVYHNSLKADCYDTEVISEGSVIYTGGNTWTVNLKKTVGEKLFKIPMETLDSAKLFMKTFPGLYIRCDDPEDGNLGGRLNLFDLSSSFIYLTWDYDDDEGHRRTKTTAYQLGTYFTVNVATAGSRSLENADPREALYAEGLCGIKPHISAKALRDEIDRWMERETLEALSPDNILVTKATLTFPYTYDGDTERYGYFGSSLFPSRRIKGNVGTIYYPLSELNYSEFESGSIDRSRMEYVSNVSFWLQELIRRDKSKITEADDLWMMGTVSYTDSYNGTTTWFSDYFYYTQTQLNGTAAARHPVLKLTYSVLK